MNQNESIENYLPELDGIRGVAILFILLFHCLPFEIIANHRILSFLKISLWIGVDLFFVLSGFLITRILIGLKGRNNKYIVFYGRRSLRIFPLYYFTLVIVFFFLSKNYQVKEALLYTAPKQYFFLYGYNLYILINNSFAISDFLNHFWSLCVEEQFYLFWPFVIFSFKTQKLPYVMTVAVIISVISKILFYFLGLDWSVIFTNTITRMDCFALGGLSAYGYINRSYRRSIYIIKIVFYLSAVVLFIYAFVAKGLRIDSITTQVLITPLIALLFSTCIYLVVVDRFKLLKTLFLCYWLRQIGKYSYGIYIYHWLIYVTIVQYNILRLKNMNSWISFGVIIGGTFIISILSYHFLERPFLNLKKYLFSRA